MQAIMSLSRPILLLVALGVSVASQTSTCQTEGDACTFSSYTGNITTPGFCNFALACGDIGSICTSENDCYESGVAPGSCSSGVCGGVGASCFWDGMCNTGFCPNSLGNCTNTCPDGTTSTYLSPYCTCPEGQTFNEATNQCGCPAGSFATSGSGANLMCGVCPTNAWSDPASTSCGCPGRGIFSNFDGVGSCCPPESTPSNLIVGGLTCSCSNTQQLFNSTTGDCDCPADTFANFTTAADNTVSSQCITCPSQMTALAGTEYSCNCAAGSVTSYQFDGSVVCLTCPEGSTYFALQGSCQCTSESDWYDIGSNTCKSCPDGLSVDPTYYESCICNQPDQYFDNTNGTCTCESADPTQCSCQGEAIFSTTTFSCQCPLSTQYYTGSGCETCPDGLTVVAGAFTTCLCPGLNVAFNATSGTCDCSSSDPTLCSCQGDSTLTVNVYGETSCVCNQSEQLYQDSIGCVSCPSYSTFSANSTTCTCNDPSAYFELDNLACNCYGATHPDPKNLGYCLPCGAGTDPASYQGCTCLHPNERLDSVTMSCTAEIGPSALAKRNAKRDQQLSHLRLAGLRTGNWKEMSDADLCPHGQQACPVLPSLTSHECIDTSSEIDSCGGCVSVGEGIDCLAVPGVASATCFAGLCETISCHRGWARNLTANGGFTCVKR